MARKLGGKFRSVTFRMPEGRYDLLAAVAEERGIDVSALLNSIVSEAAPDLAEWLAERRQTTPEVKAKLKEELGLTPEEAEAVRLFLTFVVTRDKAEIEALTSAAKRLSEARGEAPPKKEKPKGGKP